ncbi:hypothetical protein ACFV14_29875 [Streptomyces zaomyceticus]|uniref:hypothetical protein n=1 Tax=Streptomyces zaomyceticus TaxID=68286 RepID=UPI0036B617DE
MRTENVFRIQLVRLAVTAGAIAASPFLLVVGGLVRRRMLRRHYGENGPGFACKEDGWVSPGYFFITNVVVRALCLPSEYVLLKVREA